MFNPELPIKEQKEFWPDTDHIAVASLQPYLEKLDQLKFTCEIGVWTGCSSIYMLETFSSIEMHSCADPYVSYSDNPGTPAPQHVYDKFYQTWLDNQRLHTNRIDFHKITSKEFAAKLLDNYFDFIFVDGDHSRQGVYSDLKLFYDKVRPGGIIAGHDWESQGWFGVQEGVLDFMKELPQDKQNFELVPKRDCFLIYKR